MMIWPLDRRHPAPRRQSTLCAALLLAGCAGQRGWSLYGDAVLERLVDEALANHADDAVAAARVLEAQALAGLADADRDPSLSAKLPASRSEISRSGPVPIPASTPRLQNNDRPRLEAAYEADFWENIGAPAKPRAPICWPRSRPGKRFVWPSPPRSRKTTLR